MGIDINKFEAARNKARKMIHEDAKKDSHIIKERIADRNNSKFFRDQPNDGFSLSNSDTTAVNENEYSDDKMYVAMDNKMSQFLESSKRNNGVMQQSPTPKNKNLPKEILESFSNNFIDQSVFNPNRSVLDTMGIEGDTIQEQEAQPSLNNVTQITTKVDYELIKNIVEGAVKKYVNALGKKMLTENKTSDNNIKAIQFTGDKFKIVTSKGDLYEAKMSFVKNINDK